MTAKKHITTGKKNDKKYSGNDESRTSKFYTTVVLPLAKETIVVVMMASLECDFYYA